ncbi:glycosyltransferase family 2 protein [Nonlabens xiamenensis]|uniref:glycosyltransferase family 2 protein n=1 Tax=Nonlabens xiamenensis TaxID=2341043 RepID=UPI000F61393D|nr:glycosyltransferase [Nonlabens xiamenensis]
MICLKFCNPHTALALDAEGKTISLKAVLPIQQLFELARRHPDRWLGWYSEGDDVNWDDLLSQASTCYTMLSTGKAPDFIYDGYDYLEDSPYLNYQPEQWYSTWVMSADTGMIHASVLNAIENFPTGKNFEYDLNLLSRSLYKQGLFCYSKLRPIQKLQVNNKLTYRFAATILKKKWLGFLLLSHLVYEKRFPLLSFAKALVFNIQPITANLLTVQSVKKAGRQINTDYEVVIPTMGRASYLKDVLSDLKAQHILPKKIIIIEQNADRHAKSELGYLKEDWGFEIEHHFIHQTGACNARNLAFNYVSAPWVLLFDDDIRFKSTLMSEVFDALERTGASVINMACLQEHDQEHQLTFKQWPYFGSGCSMLRAEIIKEQHFDMALEHGYGEDVDFGMQIRNSGHDIIYAPQIQLKHLKAPIGGFRKPHTFAWSDDLVQPKPSPQIMYFRKKNYAAKQLKGYKLMQLFKTYGKLGTYNPYKHFVIFKKRWNLSASYAASL